MTIYEAITPLQSENHLGHIIIFDNFFTSSWPLTCLAPTPTAVGAVTVGP